MRLLLPISILIVLALGCRPPSPNANQSTASPTPEPTPIPAFTELKKQANELLAQYKKNPDADIQEPIKQTSKALATITDPKNAKAAADLKKKLDEADLKITADLGILGPKPTSYYNGKVLEVDRYLSRVLNDYDSSEYVEWSPVIKVREKDGPYWAVRLKLRAKNAFGGYILRDTYYYIRNGQVVRSTGLGG